MEPLLFQLSEELEYSAEGDFEKTATIELHPPSYNSFKHATRLSQYVMAASMASTRFKHLAGNEKAEDAAVSDDALDADAVKMILMSSDDKFEDIHKCFRKLASKVGKVSEKVTLKDPHFAKMSYEDNVRILCEYIANFIIPSLF